MNQSDSTTQYRAPQSPRSYSELAELDDESLMEEVARQNGDAFAILFQRHYRKAFSVAWGILRDRGEAEDLLQTVFLEIHHQARQFDPAKGTFKGWLLQFARYRSINRREYLLFRKFYNSVMLGDLTESEHGALGLYTEPAPECTRFVRQALALLTEKQKRTIEKIHFDGSTLKDIAADTNETHANVRNHYYRGLAKLRIHLQSIQDKAAGKTGSPVSDMEVGDVEA